MKPGRHIFLTGFMGSGKTTLGRGLASLMGVDFTDLDEYIHDKEGMDARAIFAQRGEDAFRRIESERLKELIDGSPASVISLGGGSICLDKNLQLVKDSGLLVYLNLPIPALAQRLEGHTSGRPLVEGLAGKALEERVASLLQAREKYYNQAHVVVSALSMTPLQLFREIAAALQTVDS